MSVNEIFKKFSYFDKQLQGAMSKISEVEEKKILGLKS